MTIALQFASLYDGQEAFVWSDILLNLGIRLDRTLNSKRELQGASSLCDGHHDQPDKEPDTHQPLKPLVRSCLLKGRL